MSSHRSIPVLFGLLLALAGWVATAPAGLAGGGDEGTEILPLGLEDPCPSDDDPNTVEIVVVSGATSEAASAGLHVEVPRSVRVVPIDPRNPAFVTGSAAGLDITVSSRRLGLGRNGRQVALAGRMQVFDRDASDGDRLELRAAPVGDAVLLVLAGHRDDHRGDILKSFARVEFTLALPLSEARVDLSDLRDRAQELLGGTGLDLAVAVAARGPEGRRVAWAAFAVDDRRAVYDVQTR